MEAPKEVEKEKEEEPELPDIVDPDHPKKRMFLIIAQTFFLLFGWAVGICLIVEGESIISSMLIVSCALQVIWPILYTGDMHISDKGCPKWKTPRQFLWLAIGTVGLLLDVGAICAGVYFSLLWFGPSSTFAGLKERALIAFWVHQGLGLIFAFVVTPIVVKTKSWLLLWVTFLWIFIGSVSVAVGVLILVALMLAFFMCAMTFCRRSLLKYLCEN